MKTSILMMKSLLVFYGIVWQPELGIYLIPMEFS
jgi:hypothetical protein